LARYYYDNDHDEYFPGVGAVDVKTYCHYGPTYGKSEQEAEKILQGLKDFGEDLPVQPLVNEQFIVINQ